MSAGGLVVDTTAAQPRAVLLGRTDRRGRLEWVLPKGHVEHGETIEDAARREVREETGLVTDVVGTLGEIEYWFVADGIRIHKTVHHYVLRQTGGVLDSSDVEVTDLAWFPVADLDSRLRYASERRLVRRLAEVMPDAVSADASRNPVTEVPPADPGCR